MSGLLFWHCRDNPFLLPQGIIAGNGSVTLFMRDIANEKYMGDVVMGKSVYIERRKLNNMTGGYGKRYYLEDTHEGIVSKEIYQAAQQMRKERENPKAVGRPQTHYPFTGMIECGQCGSHYKHKVNNSGKKWQTDIWSCGTALKHGTAACDCGSIKDAVLREKFVEAYNQFVTERPEGETITTLQRILAERRQEETELAELYMRRLILESAFRIEQRRIKEKIKELIDRIAEQRGKLVRESDYTTIAEFDAEKVEKFIEKVIIQKGMVTFFFYNGVSITKAFSNGKLSNRA